MHLAGELIRAWRLSHTPPMSAEQLGALLGGDKALPAHTIYNWERRGKIARPALQRRFVELGICAPADWIEPAKICLSGKQAP
jgi:NAD+ synthase (glutamine-hydrolysing)